MYDIKKYILVILISVSIVLGILMCVYLFPQVVMFIISAGGKNPPQPQITYGEFPFRLEYKVNGETIIVEDIVVCEFDGFQWNAGNGKYRVWKKELKKSGEENVLIISDGEQKIYCNVGSANYYMNDQKYQTEASFTPNIYPIKGGEFMSQQEIMDKYKIELVSWEFSKPIKNSFK